MKKYLFIVLGIAISFSSCKDSSNEQNIVMQRDSLSALLKISENTVNEFISDFIEIERNLDSVSAKQHILISKTSKGSDLKPNQKEIINADIAAINKLMEQNNKKLKALNAKVKGATTKNLKLEETVVLLNNQLNTKYYQLADLNEKLRQSNAQIEFMEMVVDIMAFDNIKQYYEIDSLQNEQNTAYYVIADKHDLVEWGLIDREGGFLGMGKSSKLSDNIDLGKFTKINIFTTTNIPINTKNIKIITSHPSNTYTYNKVEKEITSILINDPEKFWSNSKYLVISK